MATVKSILMAGAGVAVGVVIGSFVYDRFVKGMATKAA